MAHGLEGLGCKSLGEVKGVDRYLLARAVLAQTKVSVKSLAQNFGMASRGGMSNAIHLIGKHIQQDPKLRKRYERLFI